MKKILIITHTLSGGGGAEKILEIMLDNFDKNNFNIDVLEIKNFGKDFKKTQGVNYLGSVRYKNKYIMDKIYLFLLVFFPKIIYKKFIKEDYDIKISFNYLVPSFLMTSVKDTSKKICWVHGSIENLDYKQYNFLKKIEYFILKLLQKKAFERADYIVGISKLTCLSIKNNFFELKDKIRLIHNGFDFKEENQKIKKENYIITLGRLEKGKNFKLAIEVMNEIINKRNKNLKLYIFGKGILKKKLSKQIKEYNLEDKVVLKGYVNNSIEHIKKSKLMLVTSFAEGFPTVIVESLSVGVPVISTFVAGSQELLRDEKFICGEITSYEVSDIANKILNLLENKEQLEKYSKNGVKSVSRFKIENQLEALYKLIK